MIERPFEVRAPLALVTTFYNHFLSFCLKYRGPSYFFSQFPIICAYFLYCISILSLYWRAHTLYFLFLFPYNPFPICLYTYAYIFKNNGSFTSFAWIDRSSAHLS
jgi:hypothetical protein